MHEKIFKMHPFLHTRAMHANVFGPGSSMPFLECPQRPLLRDGLLLHTHSASCHTAHVSMKDRQVAPLPTSLGQNSDRDFTV